jgi:hypothetical protein
MASLTRPGVPRPCSLLRSIMMPHLLPDAPKTNTRRMAQEAPSQAIIGYFHATLDLREGRCQMARLHGGGNTDENHEKDVGRLRSLKVASYMN